MCIKNHEFNMNFQTLLMVNVLYNFKDHVMFVKRFNNMSRLISYNMDNFDIPYSLYHETEPLLKETFMP